MSTSSPDKLARPSTLTFPSSSDDNILSPVRSPHRAVPTAFDSPLPHCTRASTLPVEEPPSQMKTKARMTSTVPLGLTQERTTLFDMEKSGGPVPITTSSSVTCATSATSATSPSSDDGKVVMKSQSPNERTPWSPGSTAGLRRPSVLPTATQNGAVTAVSTGSAGVTTAPAANGVSARGPGSLMPPSVWAPSSFTSPPAASSYAAKVPSSTKLLSGDNAVSIAIPTSSVATAPSPPLQSPVSNIPDAVDIRSTSGLHSNRTPAPRSQEDISRNSGICSTDHCCVLTVGRAYSLSTFDAQGLADVLNSGEESIERMAGTKVRDGGHRTCMSCRLPRITFLRVKTHCKYSIQGFPGPNAASKVVTDGRRSVSSHENAFWNMLLFTKAEAPVTWLECVV